jgi:hypothetical protein
MPENTGEIQENGRFKKGKSGNPHGKPKGSRHKASLLAEKLFETDLEIVCSQVVQQAKEGNLMAAKIILDRILPARKDRLININLPLVKNPDDAIEALRLICHAVGNGEITPVEGESLSKMIEIQTKGLELYDFEKRLQKINEAMPK